MKKMKNSKDAILLASHFCQPVVFYSIFFNCFIVTYEWFSHIPFLQDYIKGLSELYHNTLIIKRICFSINLNRAINKHFTIFLVEIIVIIILVYPACFISYSVGIVPITFIVNKICTCERKTAVLSQQGRLWQTAVRLRKK